MTEAWQYLGAAIRAIMCNAGENAVHFAYYAQLRSVISIFAGSGVRVSLGKCYYVDDAGVRHNFTLPAPVQSRTHPLAWALWSEWVKTPYASDLMGKNMPIISGISLADLVLVPSSSGALLGAWGYDLAKGVEDHTARNKASYRAKSSQVPEVMSAASVQLIRKMWTLMQQSGDGVLFDTTLVRYFVERYIANAVQQARVEGQILDRDMLLQKVIEQTCAKTGASKSMLEEVFRGEVDTGLFDLASASDTKVENVVSRALFLVRIATLALADSLKVGPNADCRQWLSYWLESGGLYDRLVHSEPADIAMDYEEALQEFDSVDVSNLPAAIWSKDLAGSSALLARPEGFVAWALPL
ncbi:hypothetical protein JAK48_03480 [Stenotrophomonas maltophilia]|nr:hypothetical protein [Stenotrophomonas maltophilia]